MGTLTRLVHAVAGGLVAEGWAVDEGTTLVVDGAEARVRGLRGAYRVAGAGERLSVALVRADAPRTPGG